MTTIRPARDEPLSDAAAVRQRIDWNAALNMWEAGSSTREIADRLCVSCPETISGVIQRARRRGDPRALVRGRGAPKSAENRWWAVQGHERNISGAALRARVLDVIRTEDLLNAILDDRP